MITILIPLYNGVEFLQEAVDSVKSQTFTEWEIIIGVNGHPQDSPVFQTASQFATDKIRVIDLYDLLEKGKSCALNEMVKYASYGHIAILDADDAWLPTKLEAQIPWIHKGYDVVGTRCVYFGERLVGMVPTIPTGDISSVNFLQVNPVINSSAVVKKELCWWDGSTEVTGIEDYEMWLRLRRQYKRFYNCEDILVKHRLHNESAFNSQGNETRVPALIDVYQKKKPYYRIRVFSSFGESDNCKGIFERLCETDKMDNYGPDKDIYFVNDDSYTHLILLNTAAPTPTNIPKERVVGLAFEPPQFLYDCFTPEFLQYSKENIGRYLIGDSSKLPSEFVTHYSYMWHLTPPRIIPTKDKLMSIMISQKQFAPGHQHRHAMVSAILSSNLNIDIYGRGCKFYNQPDPRICGEFTDDEPYERYHFHICIENLGTPAYTSEKYTNALLWGTTPIYLGAINPLFPEWTIPLSSNIQKDMALIRNILYNPGKYIRMIDQSVVRNKINLLKNLNVLYNTPS